MNEIIGNQIMGLRKQKGLTQEQLANELGISYQAVSKWETGISCPDISTLPLLADLFGVSIDELFGRSEPEEKMDRAEESPQLEESVQSNEQTTGVFLPWEDDDTLHAVLFCGHCLVGHNEEVCNRFAIHHQIQFQYEGPALNLQSDFDVVADGVIQGSVSAGGDVTCDGVKGDVRAGGDVTCDEVRGDVSAGGDVSCDDVGGNVVASGDVTCDDVRGDVSAQGDVNCADVGGNVTAGGDVN